MRIDPITGVEIDIEPIIDRSNGGGGLLGWWGTQYQWSPNGQYLAWIRADSVGLVDLETGDLGLSQPLLNFPLYSVSGEWSWRTTVSWSPDSTLLIATIHGPPVGSEREEFSPVFNIAATSVDHTFTVNIVERAGIWSSPRYSPEIQEPESPFVTGYIAFLRARNWESSVSGEYDLVVADRDGSNARIIFPEEGRPGLVAQQFAQDFTWSPDGRQLAFIYQGNLWMVDVESGVAHQLTLDGGASKPVWTR
jgi:Tol biopolymer transport system component